MLHTRVRLRLTQELENLPISPVLQVNKAYIRLLSSSQISVDLRYVQINKTNVFTNKIVKR